MIHYNVWFSFQPGADEVAGLAQCRSFLADLQSCGRIEGYQLLKNVASTDKAKLPPFHAIIQFRDNQQMGQPFDEVRRIGIHLGDHGLMIENVNDFVVEIFDEI